MADAPYSQQSMISWADKYSRDFMDTALYCSSQGVGRGGGGYGQGPNCPSFPARSMHRDFQVGKVKCQTLQTQALRHFD